MIRTEVWKYAGNNHVSSKEKKQFYSEERLFVAIRLLTFTL